MSQPDRFRAVHDLAKIHRVDTGGQSLSVIGEIRRLLAPVVDHGTSMDTGGGFGSSDMWFTIDGVEYVMTIRPSGQP